MFSLEVNNLTCVLPSDSGQFSRRTVRHVLHGVSFSMEEGTTLGILGGSGSGKTTLARVIAGLLAPDAGTITFHGLNIWPIEENRASVLLEIQMLFQSSGASLDPTMTVYNSVMEGLSARDPVFNQERKFQTVEDVIQAVGLGSEVSRRYPHQLSGGQKQRVALARSIAVQPALLVLDEPTAALDALTQVRILKLLKTLQNELGFSILFISHDIAATFSFCDSVAVLYHGTIVETGSANDLLQNPRHFYTKRLLGIESLNASISQISTSRKEHERSPPDHR